ncbi:MAG: hypothetical protein ACM3ZE_02315 [Myxococcales bacterium]
MKAGKKAFSGLVALGLVCGLGLIPSADACVRHLTGTLTTSAVECATLCTAGPLTGDLNGKFEFVMQEMVETGVPNVVRYTGTNTITTDKGTLVGNNVGYWNLSTGECVDYTDLTTGTGVYAGAHGQLTIAGRYDPNTGLGANKYIAFITTP